MGSKPSPLIPIPRRVALTPTSRPWPARFDVDGRADAARELAGRFAIDPVAHGPPLTCILALDERPARAEPQSRIIDGGYALRFDPDSVTVMARDAAGFRHALQTLRQLAADKTWPIGEIDDHPALPLRGIHLNFESNRRLDLDAALRLIDMAARFKLNAVLAEYGPRFPFAAHRDICEPDALSPGDIAALTTAATRCGISWIPLQQTAAHLEYLLRHDQFARLRERDGRVNLVCPLHPDTLPLVKSLLDDVIDLHPGSTLIHLGGDEARKIGECPRCRPTVTREGVGPVFGRHLGELARFVIERGRRPVVWDDTLCAHPDAFRHLPRETIIHYWDYIAVADPTPVLIPRMAHARGGPRVAHDWRWTLPGRRRKTLSDVQIAVMDAYSKPARLKSALGAEYLREFGPFLGDGFPEMMRALPYLEYYQSRGHDVLLAPTGMGNGDSADGVPNFTRFEHNIAIHGARAIQAATTPGAPSTTAASPRGRCLGMITTAWYNMPPEILVQPLIRTAQSAW